MPPQRSSAPSIDPASVALQERLHELMSRLSDTTNMVRQWPDGQDDPSIHVESTSKLISLIRSVLTAIQSVENTVVRDPNLKERLNQCLIPMDLIELLDHGSASATMTTGGGGGGGSSSAAAAAAESGGGGLNPDAFSRGLLKEALGQLAGLKRRKLALEMLSLDISQRQRKRQQAAAAAAEDAAEAAVAAAASTSATEANKKRSRSDEETPLDADDDDDDDDDENDKGGEVEEPPAKKQHVA